MAFIGHEVAEEQQTDAIELLKEDHRKVKGLFEEFEQAGAPAEKQRIAETTMRELKIHSKVEEEIFYPAVQEALRQKGEDQELMHEAEEEHHVVDLLMAELESMPAGDEQYSAKFTVLAENVKHHIKEEEGEMFPKASDSGVDTDSLGQKMLERKQALMQEIGKPGSKQNGHHRAANHRGRRSPAASARRHTRPAARSRSGRRGRS